MQNDYYIGLMSGTSLDAVDAVLVTFDEHNPAQKIKIIATHSEPTPPTLKSLLIKLCNAKEISYPDLAAADHQVGKLFAYATRHLVNHSKIPAENITAIGSHGQTIHHAPNGNHPFTLQIGDPNIIAAETNITTVADFRRRDVAHKGQGAPLAPAFHAYLLKDIVKEAWILNIGGIANLTHLNDDSKKIMGFDTGPGNTLLDNWCLKHHHLPFDDAGHWARQGEVIPELLSKLLADPYFKLQPPKSTGRESFNLDWLQTHLPTSASYQPKDIQRTLLELTAITIVQAVKFWDSHATPIFVCGGGVHNEFLMQRLNELASPHAVKNINVLGIDPRWVEASAFAWLAYQTLSHQPGNLPSVTGAQQASILGGVYFKN